MNTVHASGITPELLLLRCFTSRYRHQEATLEDPISYLCPCALYLFLTVTNGSSECRPGVNTHLRMTGVVVEDTQHPSKILERRTQHSRGKKDKNKKLLTIPADENGTQITPETIFRRVESLKSLRAISTYSIKHKVLVYHTNMFHILKKTAALP